MVAEIIAIGDEVLTGHTVNTNGSFISRQLTAIGVDVRYHTTVGDSIEFMEEAFRTALRRASLVIVTGGLGPTDDDITKKAIVKVFKRNLIFQEDILEELKERWTRRGMEMPPINQNQALLPQGAKFFSNQHGSAVGICIAEQGKVFIALPGVPREMEQILDDEVIPYIRAIKTNRKTAIIKLHTTGLAESKLAELIKPKLKLEPGVKLAYLPGFDGVHLRLISVAETDEEAKVKAEKLSHYLESIIGKYIYGRGDDSLELVIGQLLLDNDRTLSVAESCSAGMLGTTLTNVSGSSRYFMGGVISYANEVKIKQLSVDQSIIDEHGAVSEECAIAMAEGARKLIGTTYALSVTGVAGPDGGTDEKPVGTTWVGLATPQTAFARKFNFGTLRESNRTRATYAAMELLRWEILDIK